jgi:hypothetical protein
MELLGFHWMDGHEIRYLGIFRKSFEKNRVSLKADKNKGYFTLRPINIIVSRSFLLRMKSVSDKRCTENQNTHFLVSKIVRGRSHMAIGQVTDGNRAGHRWQ